MWRRLVFECALALSCLTALAETRGEALTPALRIEEMETETASRHEREVARLYRRWMAFIPNLGVMQYAGNIGACALGLGWDYGKNDRWETMILVGLVPGHYRQKADVTFTVRENLIPWSIGLGSRRWAQPATATGTGSREQLTWNRRAFASIEPAVFTTSLSTIFDNQFWVHEPEKYNGGDYYRFSSKIRLHLGIGSRISLNVPQHRQRHYDRVSLYYELSTYDLAILSAIPNKKVTMGDILCLGIGVQYKFF